MTRIDSPHCTGKILAANDTTHCVGLEGDCSGKPDDSTTSPQLSVKRNFPKVDSSPPTIDWAKTFKGGMSAGGSVHHTSSPPPLDPPEPSEDELRTFCNTIYQRMMTFRYSSAFDLLRGQLAEAREHGRQEVAKRLPRLWGICMSDGHGWATNGDGKPWISSHRPDVDGTWKGRHVIREFDPMTGGPKE